MKKLMFFALNALINNLIVLLQMEEMRSFHDSYAAMLDLAARAECQLLDH